MCKEITIPEGVDETGELVEQVVSNDEKSRLFRNTMNSLTTDAIEVWVEIWEEFVDKVVTRGCIILPEAKDGFKPDCGWPEFFEKIWLLKHYLDHSWKYSKKGR